MKFKIKEDRDDVVQVSIEGCLNQQDVAPPIDPIRALLGPSAYQKTVLLDMRDSSYLDSLCIGWLLSCHKRFREQGGEAGHPLTPHRRRECDLAVAIEHRLSDGGRLGKSPSTRTRGGGLDGLRRSFLTRLFH